MVRVVKACQGVLDHCEAGWFCGFWQMTTPSRKDYKEGTSTEDCAVS